MKFLSFLLLTFSLASAFAQEGSWVVGVSYGVPSSQRTLFAQRDIVPGSIASKSIHGSYGAGLSLGTGFQKITKNKWGWSIEVTYLVGDKIKTEATGTAVGGSLYELQIESKSNALFVSPMIFKNLEEKARFLPLRRCRGDFGNP